MPHLTLEFSANIIEKNNLAALFPSLHKILATTLPTNINGCKSRAIECEQFYVGEGAPNSAFIHVTLKVLPGRTPEHLQELGQIIMNELKQYFQASLTKLKLQITLEILEISTNYFKIVSE